MSDEPISLAENRAFAANDASKWTPRDALLSALKMVEEDENIDIVYIAMRRVKDKVQTFPARIAGGDSISTMGLLSKHLWDACE